MHEIVCPHCNKAFKIDEAGYADILSQVKNQEFERELEERLHFAEEASKKDIELAKERVSKKLGEELAEKDSEITKLAAELANAELAKKYAVQEALSKVEKERDEFKHKADLAKKELEVVEVNLKDKYETQLKDRDITIDRLREMKAQLSTKMLGETLEQHCLNAFDAVRAMAFPNAYFAKDNDAKDGSKGDFIFREKTSDDVEVISIMFEMKNEAEETSTKKKNEDFFKELDKDRNQKSCEYAVLVSVLEADSELYNAGIVDVSHKFPKMFVVRPQFFIPMITLLRNAALKSVEVKTELAQIREQNIDITNFETHLEAFKEGFAKNYNTYTAKHAQAIADIDRSIKVMEKVKDELISADRQLRLANDKAQDISIKKLTRGNPTMAQRFAEIESSSDETVLDE